MEPDPPLGPPAKIRPVTSTSLTGVVGAAVSGGVTVHILDYRDRDVPGAKVSFAIIDGDGSVDHRHVIADAAGNAHVEWTLSQTAGNNQLEVTAFGTDSSATFTATGTAGVATGVNAHPHVLRLTGTTGTITARVVDQFRNNTSGSPVTYSSRDPGIATVNASTGVVTRIATSGQTWVIATSAQMADSAKVIALGPSDTPCTGITAIANLAVGEVSTSAFFDNGVCVPVGPTDREYALVPYFDTFVSISQTFFNVNAFGIRSATGPLTSSRPARQIALGALSAPAAPSADLALRSTERRELAVRAPAARAWYKQRLAGRRANQATALPSVGDQLQFNVNPDDYCANPTMVTARVVAVTSRAIVLADVANPEGGFTDVEYAAFGTAFDTLVYPVDLANFGEPTDVDGNTRTLILFTKSVTDILGPGTLGFAYSRDLLPKSGDLGSCPGSNVAEMVYLRVPTSSIPKTSVARVTVATMAHEYQHVINASRRLFVNTTGAPTEEVWLNEGLSHVAEELVFYQATETAPRQNLDTLTSTAVAKQYLRDYLGDNFDRFYSFASSATTQAPAGLDDDLESRGAAWAFLRYLADHRFAANESAFWKALVNSSVTGLENLGQQVPDLRAALRDWSFTTWLDDLVPTDPKYQHLSWNIRKVRGAFFTYAPVQQQLTAQVTTVDTNAQVLLRGMSASFIRFGVAAGKEAYISLAGQNNNTPLNRSVKLAIVRTK